MPVSSCYVNKEIIAGQTGRRLAHRAKPDFVDYHHFGTPAEKRLLIVAAVLRERKLCVIMNRLASGEVV